MPLIASLSLVIAIIALIFSTRKEAHHVRLELSRVGNYSLVLGVNNDSAVSFGILSIGYFQNTSEIKWITTIANHTANAFITYPVRVDARSLFLIDLCPMRNDITCEKFGVCVQLETGRIYTLRNNMSLTETAKLEASAFISQITRGKFSPGMPNRPRLPVNSKRK